MKIGIKTILATAFISTILLTTSCSDSASDKKGNVEPDTSVKGEIQIDGSSTVYPITAAAGEFAKEKFPNLNISVAYAGTGGGFKKFSAGEIPIVNASREIKKEEIELCKKNNIEYVNFEIAYDGISIVVNKENTWAKEMTVEQLKKMWEPDSTVKTWKDIDESWPDEKISFYSPGTDSGTFEYFTEAIVGQKAKIRKDITPNEDDNTLVKGVEGDKNAIGYFGYAYYQENKEKLNVIKVNPGDGAVEPNPETIKTLKYKPLSRPLYIYVNKSKMGDVAIKEFIKYYLENADEIVKTAKYIPLSDYSKELEKLK